MGGSRRNKGTTVEEKVIDFLDQLLREVESQRRSVLIKEVAKRRRVVSAEHEKVTGEDREALARISSEYTKLVTDTVKAIGYLRQADKNLEKRGRRGEESSLVIAPKELVQEVTGEEEEEEEPRKLDLSEFLIRVEKESN